MTVYTMKINLIFKCHLCNCLTKCKKKLAYDFCKFLQLREQRRRRETLEALEALEAREARESREAYEALEARNISIKKPKEVHWYIHNSSPKELMYMQ